jgi:hypothetical protein
MGASVSGLVALSLVPAARVVDPHYIRGRGLSVLGAVSAATYGVI